MFEELGEESDNAFYLSRAVETYRVSAETWYRSQGSCLLLQCEATVIAQGVRRWYHSGGDGDMQIQSLRPLV
jgi:hypothetical protein